MPIMEITLNRYPSTEVATIGQLLLNESHQCYTLEDVVRPSGEKVYGKTAIPAGRYQIIINRSNRFSALAGHDVFLPLLLAVPGFEGVRIHPGNTAADTDGCILPGMVINDDGNSVGRSREAFDQLFFQLKAALANEEVWITINDAPAPLAEAV